MGWVAIAVLALLVGLLLWRFGRMPRAALEPVAAALLLGLAGYALQGSPFQPANEVSARPEKPDVDEEAIAQRNAMGERFGSEAGWMVAADGAMRAGMTRSAVTYIRSGLRENPDSADLWVGMGNALIAHADGMITPAAQYAFAQAARIAPEHPGPPFFMGLAMVQAGQIDQARAIWQQLLDRTPANAPWRADLEMRLGEIGGAGGG
jgi:cytochrome c-type biogenesis protein CcmH